MDEFYTPGTQWSAIQLAAGPDEIIEPRDFQGGIVI